MTMIYRFGSEIPPITPLRLKVEVNTRERFTVFGFSRKRFAVDSPWFQGSAELLTYGCSQRSYGRSTGAGKDGTSTAWPPPSSAYLNWTS
jgi:hypothetical protein